MGRWFIATMVAVLLSGSAAMAQTSTSSPGMLPTSPLGIQGSRPVGPAGIPMGATGLATDGVSPLPSGTSIYGSSTGSNIPCSVAGSSTSGGSTSGVSAVPSSTGTFDGGGIAGMPSATPPGGISGTGVSPATTAMAMSGSGTSPCGGAATTSGSVSGVPAVTTPSPAISNILPGSSNCPTNGMSNAQNPGAIPSTTGFPGVC